MLCNTRQVGLSAIALVVAPFIMGVLLVYTQHELVPMGLGKDAGGSYGRIFCIALYYALMRNTEVGREYMPVYEQQLRTSRKGIYCMVHGLERGFEDIDTVYLGSIAHSNRPGDGLPLYYRPQFIAVRLGHLLAVVEQGMMEPRRQYDSRSKYRSCKATPAGLIAAGLNKILGKTGFQHRAKIKNTV